MASQVKSEQNFNQDFLFSRITVAWERLGANAPTRCSIIWPKACTVLPSPAWRSDQVEIVVLHYFRGLDSINGIASEFRTELQ